MRDYKDQEILSLDKWFFENKNQILEDYFTFLKFKTISSNPNCHDEMNRAVQWLLNYFSNMGFVAKEVKTSSNPIVIASAIVNEKAPTLLIYGHYDVQDIDPLEEWKSNPFEPFLKDNHIYARGALDNKGQLAYVFAALKAFKRFPVNIKLCIEGDEEASSHGMLSKLHDLKEDLRCDYLLVPDFEIPEMDVPAITLGLRGAVPIEVELIGSNVDLHSGSHGGIVFNPLKALVLLFSKLWDEKGRVAIPHFYDDVEELAKEERQQIDFSFDERKYKKSFGVEAFGGEKGFSPIEAGTIRPTLEINGIGGGYFGPGLKTVIPAKVSAKLSCRLVLRQDPKKIGLLVENFLKSNITPGIKINVKRKEGGAAFRERGNTFFVNSVKKAYEEVFEKPCRAILAGGSVPLVARLKEVLKCEIVMMGMGVLSDNIHAPNEHFDLERFKKGFLIVSKIIEKLGKK